MNKKKMRYADVVERGGDQQVKLLVASFILLVLVVVSALSVVYSTYKSRQLFSEFQQQKRQAMRLEEQWGRLLLERSTWASHERIDRLAKSKLKMIVPNSQTMVVVKQ
jgi:cell division protein FtsL